VAVVGAIPAGLPELGFDSLPWNIAPALLPAALLIGLVSYVESLSIAKSLANRNRQRIDANQELIALGGANFAAAVSGGMPVAGGFSRTMVNYNAGARTQLASLVTAALVGLVAAFFAHLLSTVPKAALAAIIVVAVVKLIDLRGALAVWRYDRLDGGVLAITAAAVLIIGIEIGLAIGIAASLGSLVLRMSRPHIAVLGRIAGSEHFRNVRRHRVETWPQLLFMRVDENMTFTNAGRIESAIVSEIAAHPSVLHVILVMSSVSAIDSTAVESMERLAQSLRPSGLTLHLSDVKGPVMDRLRHSNLLAAIAPGQVFLSANVAAEDLSRRQD
jgi:SulP family sulfate permease